MGHNTPHVCEWPKPPMICRISSDMFQFITLKKPEIVARSLGLVTQSLADHGIWHCLAFGTLLGAVRDGCIIPWDHDFDLFARPTDARRILALNPKLARHGLEIGRLRYPGSMLAMNPGGIAWFDPMHLQVRLNGSFIGDLFMPSLFSDGVLRIYDFETEIYWTPQFSMPHFFIGELGSATIDGRAFPVMQHAGQFLSLIYGRDWRVPYRSVIDGGEPKQGVTIHSHRYVPSLRQAVAWAMTKGWDLSAYQGLPAWPRALAGAGPIGPTPRTAATSRSLWWHDLDELGAHC
jgi:hypothetical protein